MNFLFLSSPEPRTPEMGHLLFQLFVTNSASLFYEVAFERDTRRELHCSHYSQSVSPTEDSSSLRVLICFLDSTLRETAEFSCNMKKLEFVLSIDRFKRQSKPPNRGNCGCSMIPAMSEHPVWPGPRAFP